MKIFWFKNLLKLRADYSKKHWELTEIFVLFSIFFSQNAMFPEYFFEGFPLKMSLDSIGGSGVVSLYSSQETASGLVSIIVSDSSGTGLDFSYYEGNDDGGNKTSYASIHALIVDTSDGTSDGHLIFSTTRADTQAPQIKKRR